jgi:molecular chaperone DnaK
MPYVLGIDVGSGLTRAAVCRRHAAGWGEPELVPLGGDGAAGPTELYRAGDRSVLVGADAQRHAPTEPVRIGRHFIPRVGDDTPLVLGGSPYGAHELTAVLVRWVTDRVAEQEGGPALRIVLTHPASWGPQRRSLVQHELRRQGLTEVTLLAEPVAVAHRYATGRLSIGDTLAVYDLGASHADASVLRRAEHGGFELVGQLGSTDPLGGDHFDDAIVDLVTGQLGRAFDTLDPADPRVLAGMASLRAVCAEARELLSVEPEVLVPVRLPGMSTDIGLRRTEFEQAIRPAVGTGLDLLTRVVAATVPAGRPLAMVAMVGGAVRTPLVTEQAAAALPVRLAVEPEPELTIAIGAATAARWVVAGPDDNRHGADQAQPTEVISLAAIEKYGVTAGVDVLAELPIDRPADDDPDRPVPPPRPPVDITPMELPGPGPVRRVLANFRPATLTVVMIVLVAAGVVLTFVLEHGSTTQPSNPLHVGPAQPAANVSVTSVSPPPSR